MNRFEIISNLKVVKALENEQVGKISDSDFK